MGHFSTRRSLAITALFVLALTGFPQAGSAATTRSVAVGRFGALTYTPSALQADAGDTVQWSFESPGHSVYSYGGDPGSNFNAGPGPYVADGEYLGAQQGTYSATFGGGTKLYRCGAHSYIDAFGVCNGMCGAVTDKVAAPSAPTISSPADGSSISTQPVAFSGTAAPWTLVAVLEQGVLVGQARANATGSWSFSAEVSQSAHTIVATAAEANGLTSAESSPVTFTQTVDFPDRQAPSVVAQNGSGTRVQQPTIQYYDIDLVIYEGQVVVKGTATDNVAVSNVYVFFEQVFTDSTYARWIVGRSYQVLDRKQVTATCTGCGTRSATWSATAPGLSPGTYRVFAVAVDPSYVNYETTPANAGVSNQFTAVVANFQY